MTHILRKRYTELLLGAGADHRKIISPKKGRERWTNLITLDNNPDHKPDVLHDLNTHPLPFASSTFNEIHAYEVLEHLGSQGDYRFFFAEFEEYYRVLKPGGAFMGSVPAPDSRWVWGDPSHTRAFRPEWLDFLSQANYEANVGKNAMSDFRSIYHADFAVGLCKITDDNLFFALESLKTEEG